MFSVELYGRVRHACHIEGLSQREAARRFGIHRSTVRKMLTFSVPPGYRRTKPPSRPKLEAFTAIIDAILEADRASPPKQRHTAKRIFERLRAEHGFAGGYTIVKDYVRERRQRQREVFVPLAHPPGHAQVDFGEAVAVIGGVRAEDPLLLPRPAALGCRLRQGLPGRADRGLPRRPQRGVRLLGRRAAARSSTTTPSWRWRRILGDGKRQRTRAFAELQSHYLFLDRFGRPGKGNDKGKVEGLVGYARRNFLVPIPTRRQLRGAERASAEQHCLERLGDRLRGHAETHRRAAGARPGRPQPRPATPYDACDKQAGAGHLAVAGALRRQRLLGADRLRPPRGAGARLRRRGGDLPAAPRSSPGTPAPTSARTSSSTRCITWRCWSGRPARSTRPRRWRAGTCPRRSRRCAACWRRAWASPASASTSRCCACWRFPASRTCTRPCARRSRAGRDRLRRGQAPGAVPDRAAAAPARPDDLSLPAAGHGRDHLGQAPTWRCSAGAAA